MSKKTMTSYELLSAFSENSSYFSSPAFLRNERAQNIYKAYSLKEDIVTENGETYKKGDYVLSPQSLRKSDGTLLSQDKKNIFFVDRESFLNSFALCSPEGIVLLPEGTGTSSKRYTDPEDPDKINVISGTGVKATYKVNDKLAVLHSFDGNPAMIDEHGQEYYFNMGQKCDKEDLILVEENYMKM